METMVQSQNVIFTNWNESRYPTDFNSSNFKRLIENYQKAMDEMMKRNNTQEMLCSEHVGHMNFKHHGSS